MSLLTGKNKAFRIAVMGIYHESNTFIERTTRLQDFRNGRWLKGQAIIDEYKDAHHELGGAIEVFTDAPVELVPIFYAETTPGGTVEETAYQAMLSEIITGLTASLPVDACFVVPHGAGVAQHHTDLDGSWLAEVKNVVGNDTPIVGTLDAHANVSELMIKSTNALFAYQTNPHLDQRETGKRAARFLLSLLQNKTKAQQYLWQAPLAISIEKQNTFSEPCKSLYEFARNLCHIHRALEVNVVLGFPYADVKEMGTSVIIITENSSTEIKQSLHDYFTTRLNDFVGNMEPLQEQLAQVADKPNPILFLDMGDNVGGGSEGNSTYLIENLERTNYKYFIAIFDQGAVHECYDRKINESFSLSFGSHPVTKQPCNLQVKLIDRYDGRFSEKEPRHGGQVHYDMGDTLILSTSGSNIIMLHSKRVPPFSLQQLLSCGIDPASFDIIVAKGVNAPIAAYSPVCPSIVFINSPGSTQANMTGFKYLNRRKPLFPFEMPVAS